VAFADEGIIKKRRYKIANYGAESEHKLSAIIQHKLEPEIYCLKGLACFLENCKTKPATVSYSHKR
jgi:alanine racemase